MVTQNIAQYIQDRGITIAKISEVTNINYQKLCRSLKNKSRDLRADELLLICGFLEVNPYEFMDNTKTASWKKEEWGKWKLKSFLEIWKSIAGISQWETVKCADNANSEAFALLHRLIYQTILLFKLKGLRKKIYKK